jgi:phosphatidylinositol glycan class V
LRWKDEDPSEEEKKEVESEKQSEEDANVDKVLTWATIARAATCVYLYFGHPKLFPSSRAFDTSASILLEKSAIIGPDSPLQNFLRWDALYYVDIAMTGYRYEQELAFLPGWPLCMRAAGKAVQYIRGIKGRGPADLDVFDVLVGGIVMANVLSIAASVAFYK